MFSKIGKFGGKMIGEKIDVYVIEGGLFEVVCVKLLISFFELFWFDCFFVMVKELL